MSLVALLLGIAGTALALGAGGVLWIGRPGKPAVETAMIGCEAPCPDDTMFCDQEVGHLGWHRCGEASWFGDSWAVDHWADTQEAPAPQEPTMPAPTAEPVAPAPAAAEATTEKLMDDAELDELAKEAGRASRKLAAEKKRRHMEKLVAAGPPRPKQWQKYCEYLNAAQKIGGDPVPMQSCTPSATWALWELKAEAKRIGCTRYSNLDKFQLLDLMRAKRAEIRARDGLSKLDKDYLVDMVIKMGRVDK